MSTELVKAQPQSMTAYEPRDINDAMRLAEYFAKSGLTSLQRPEAVFLVMATGSELGIPATAALRAIHNIKGKPSPAAQLLVALCLRRKDVCEYFRCTESTEERATYVTKRVGNPERSITFTLDQARRAGLAVDDKDSNWYKWRPDMLKARASAPLAREVYPELTLGLTSREEMEDVIEGTIVEHTPPKVIMEADLPGTSPPVNPALAQASIPKVEKAAAVTAATEPAATDAKAAESADDKAERLIEACKAMTVANKGAIRKEGTSLPKGQSRDKFVAAYSEALKRLDAEQKATSAEAIK